MAFFNLLKKKTPPTTAVILCAGNSSRMGKDKNKVLLPLGKKPLLWYTLNAFETCESIHDILVVTRECDLVEVSKTVHEGRFSKVTKVILGGETRNQSVKCALANLPKDAKYVAIHDGARPFVTKEMIASCCRSAQKTGGAIVAIPCNDTVKKVEDGGIQTTVDRTKLYLAQTPQVFDVKKLLCAISLNPTADYTDDSLYFENARFPVAVVEGSSHNFKVTRESDYQLALGLVKEKKL